MYDLVCQCPSILSNRWGSGLADLSRGSVCALARRPSKRGYRVSTAKIYEHVTNRFSEGLRAFVNDEQWTFARTMPVWPHEYLVRSRVDPQLFEAVVTHIRSQGYEGLFYSKSLTYYEEDGLVYWTMGAPVEETTIINRCKAADTFESRSRSGTLPA